MSDAECERDCPGSGTINVRQPVHPTVDWGVKNHKKQNGKAANVHHLQQPFKNKQMNQFMYSSHAT